jgi:hypothetical protein
MDSDVRPGSIHSFGGTEAIAITFGIFAKKQGKWIHIHMTGDYTNFAHITVTNNPKSVRYHRTLFRNLRRLLIAYHKWQFGNEGAETETN